MKLRILLLATILILLFATCSCEALKTTITSTTKVTQTTMKTETETQTQTQTATDTITETETETETVTITIIPIRVKRSAHGQGQIEALDMESEYLPVVVASENPPPDAPFESLKAQAIAARTYAFYKKLYEPRSIDYDILDSEQDQVYDPAQFAKLTPEQQEQIRQAIRDTNGIILKYDGVIICSHYVSGKPNMVHFVTFNEGKSGDNITQTTLSNYSYPPSLTPRNRGCMGQIQANELATQGYTYDMIIRYFYGEDINIEKYSAYY
jgi:peptidoglycan hydrolase-like amidase